MVGRRVEVIRGEGGHRQWSTERKRVRLALGVVVSEEAEATALFAWRRQAQRKRPLNLTFVNAHQITPLSAVR